MLMSPTSNIYVEVKQRNNYLRCELVNISKTQIKLSCLNKPYKYKYVSFKSELFSGIGSLKKAIKTENYYIYEIDIKKIYFKKGLIINLKT